MVNPWGWAGTVTDFLATTEGVWLSALRDHHYSLNRENPSQLQLDVWREERRVMTAALRTCTVADSSSASWGVVFEYELPLEGGRRPDVVVHSGGAISVLEFKITSAATQAHRDQVEAYARDLADYHEASHDRTIVPILVIPGATNLGKGGAVIELATADDLARELLAVSVPQPFSLDAWLHAAYAPPPALVEAARRIFQHEPLPHVRQALSAGIPDTIDFVTDLIADAEANRSRKLVLVTGVPGSGKTLVGLRLVYERSRSEAPATFLSGNGPLVKVLQDALQSRVFVRDLHAFIKTNGIAGRTPKEKIIVFDEAQRAWDRDFMALKKGVHRSEPELLVEVGQRIEDWAVLVGLVGDGQEIHSGEEGGLQQWAEALLERSAADGWTVYCPPRLESEFRGLHTVLEPRLDLTISLRTRRAEHLHRWVELLLTGSLALAAREAAKIQLQSYPMYVTRDLEDAKAYARSRYGGERVKRYGLLASSHDRLLASHGLDNSFLGTQRVNVAKWFNAPANAPEAGCALVQPITEFQCQGLELDLPIVCWGGDYTYRGDEWHLAPIRRRYPLRDPKQVLLNAYRVLLTRGRDGIVVFLPPNPELDRTEVALLAGGFRPLPEELEARQTA